MSDETPYIEDQSEVSLDEILSAEKSSIRKNSWWAIAIGSIVVLLHIAAFAYFHSYRDEFLDEFGEPLSWKLLFRSIFFVLAVVAVIGGIWGFYHAKHLRIEDIVPSAEAIEFLKGAQDVKPYYSYVLVGSIAVVMLFQMLTGERESIGIAGFVKQDFVRGEYWRILTGATLHGGLLHIYFNAQALYMIGSLFEAISNRAHLAIVFILAIIGGGLCSLVFMPGGLPSVGASGGIMGLIGYLAIFGYRRRQHLPPNFLRMMLINIALTAAIGIIGYQFIDNFAHLGGLLAGAVYGFIQIPAAPKKNVRQATGFSKLLGIIALGVYVATCVFSISLLSGIIQR